MQLCLLPNSVAYLPSAHLVQFASPLFEKEPGSQSWHMVAFVDEYLPASHVVQLYLVSLEAANLPASHTVQFGDCMLE